MPACTGEAAVDVLRAHEAATPLRAASVFVPDSVAIPTVWQWLAYGAWAVRVVVMLPTR